MQWIVAEQHYKEVDYALRYLALHYTGFTVLSIIENGEFDSVVVSDAKGVTTEIGISNGQLYVHRVRHDYLTFTPKLIQSFSISKTGRRLQFIASYDNVKKQRVNVIFFFFL